MSTFYDYTYEKLLRIGVSAEDAQEIVEQQIEQAKHRGESLLDTPHVKDLLRNQIDGVIQGFRAGGLIGGQKILFGIVNFITVAVAYLGLELTIEILRLLQVLGWSNIASKKKTLIDLMNISDSD